MQGKQKQLFTNKEFRVKYGTVDSRKLMSVYLIVDSWVQPQIELPNPISVIRKLKGSIERKLKEAVNYNLWRDLIIIDMDLRSSGFKLNKKSFMTIETTFYPRCGLEFNSDIILNEMRDISNIIINEMKINKFKFTAKKNG